MNHLITALILCIGSFARAGDTPIYPFKLGDWDFQLSSAGTPGGGPIDAVLEAKHNTKNISGEVRLDYRWYVLMYNQFERGPKAARPYFEALVGFSAREWPKGFNGVAVLKAMKESPPTADFKHSFEFLAEAPKPQAEQAGTGQPATRPESKSEGGNKPQTEAEGRSR
ncbi:MAG: hypothetical protein V4640_03280 [Verrucomicrobiota bacterium]